LTFLIFHITFVVFHITFLTFHIFFAISYYVLATYSLVLVFNRMSKLLKAVLKKLFGRKSKTGPEDTLFRGSTSCSSRRDEILKHIDLIVVGRTVYYQRS
jgi:hypothetical protein